MNATFSSSSNSRPLRSGEYRVWRFGQSAICRSHARAEALVRAAQRLDRDAHAVNSDGERVA